MNTANTTIYVGGLNDKVTEEILYELFVQTGPINKVTLPKDRESGKQRGFAFIDYKHACSVPYTINVMNGISIFNRKLSVKAKSGSDNRDNGLGLLPHPHFGPGVLPADLSEFIKDNRQERYPRDYPPMPPNFLPGMPLPPMLHPGMMGAPPQMMMMMPPGRTMNRSQTWHGDVNDIRRRDREPHARDRDSDRRDRESDRRDRRDRESDRESRDRSHDRHGQSRGRDRNSSSSRRSHDDRKRDRSDSPMSYNSDRHVDKRSRHGNDGNYSNHGHYPGNVQGSNDLQMLAMMQMQMLQQQNRPYQNSPGPASHRRY